MRVTQLKKADDKVLVKIVHYDDHAWIEYGKAGKVIKYLPEESTFQPTLEEIESCTRTRKIRGHLIKFLSDGAKERYLESS